MINIVYNLNSGLFNEHVPVLTLSNLFAFGCLSIITYTYALYLKHLFYFYVGDFNYKNKKMIPNFWICTYVV